VNDQNGRYTRLRYTAAGAITALAVAGAIAGSAALAAKPPTKRHAHAALQNRDAKSGDATKPPASAVPDKTKLPATPVNHQPFLDAIQRLVEGGTITPSEGQLVDGEIQAGTVDTETLATGGLTDAQLQAVQQALGDTKRSLQPPTAGGGRAPKQPPPAGAAIPGGGKGPAPADSASGS